MAEKSDKDMHEFMVTAVEQARDDMLDGVALTLVDARGGRVRHLCAEICEVAALTQRSPYAFRGWICHAGGIRR